MKRKALIALIISSCVVVVGCVGLVFWAFAATQVNVNSKLSVTYTPELHVVCEASATYQKKTDESETPFISGSLDLVIIVAASSLVLWTREIYHLFKRCS